MSVAALVIRLLLAAVFGVAALTKLGDRRGTAEAVVQFGVPERFAGAGALALPTAELVAAALLLPATTAAGGSSVALALLALFSAAIALNLVRGRAPECHCFGQLHSRPVGWKTLARNGVLGALAVFALAAGLARSDRSAVAWIGRLDGTELVALVVGAAAVATIGIGATAFLSLLRSYGQVLVRLERVEERLAEAGLGAADAGPPPELGLEPGTPAPRFAVADATGGSATLDSLLARGKPLLLLFSSPHCGPCKALLPQAAEWQKDYAESLTIAFATDGDREEVAAEAAEFELEHVLLDSDRRLYIDYEANGTPSAVAVAADGTIASWVAPGREWIETLVGETVGAEAGEQGLPVGAEAPDLELSLVDGRALRLAELRGQETLVVFWNPSCAFCRSMHEQLLASEATNGSSPRLVIVSAGSDEEIRAEGFRSPVALDPDSAVAARFGADGTPMGVLLDADGRVAAPLAAGAEHVLALARNGHG